MQLLNDLGVAKVPGLSIAPTEMPVDELLERIKSTLDLLALATPDKFVGKEDLDVEVKSGKTSFTRNAVRYVQEMALPSL